MGRQIMNLFPLPDPALVGNPVTQGNYNYQFAGDTEKLRRDNVVRVDWNIRPGTTFYTRIQMGKEVFGRGQYNETAPALIAGAGMGFPWSEGSYDINTAGYVATLTHTFTGSTVLEVIAGTNWATQDVYPLGQSDWDALDYRNHLPGHRQYFPENNPNHILPDMTFRRAPTPCRTRGPSTSARARASRGWRSNDTHNISVNLTHLRGKHNLKAGFFYERTGRPGAMSSNAGTYNFNSDAANPLDTNLGWANALLGHLNTYTENNNNTRSHAARSTSPSSSSRTTGGSTGSSRSISASASRTSAWSTRGIATSAGSIPRAWNAAKAVKLWQPHCANGVFPCTGANRVARQSAHRRTAAESLDRRGRRRIGRHQQRHRVRQGDSRIPSPMRASRPRRVSGSDGTSSATARPRSAAGSAPATTASATASTAASPGSSAGR